MSTEMYKSISELLDGETSDKELPRVLERLCAEPDLKLRLTRLVLVRECLQRNLPQHPGLSLGERVARVLADEPVVLAPRKHPKQRGAGQRPGWRYLRPVAGVAVAASVAAVAILGLRNGEQATSLDASTRQAVRPAQTEPVQRPQAGLDVQYADAQLRTPITQPAGLEDRAWLNQYLLRHTDSAGFAGRSGFVPYVSIVTTDPPNSSWERTPNPVQVVVPPE